MIHRKSQVRSVSYTAEFFVFLCNSTVHVWYSVELQLCGVSYTGEFIVKPLKTNTALKATKRQKLD